MEVKDIEKLIESFEASGRIGKQTPSADKHIYDPECESMMDDPEIQKMIVDFGFELRPFQNYILRDALAINKHRVLAYKKIGYTIPRQNGKTEAIFIRMLIFGCILFKEQQLYTAATGKAVTKIYTRLMKVVRRNKKLSAYFPAAKQSASEKSEELYVQAVDPKTGRMLGRCDFMTRSRDTGRSMTLDVIYYDEAQLLTEEQHSAIDAIAAARPKSQSYYVGTASSISDAEELGKGSSKSNTGTFFLKFRADVLTGKSPFTAWLEWGISKMTRKDDIEAMYEANPSLGFQNAVNLRALLSFAGSDESFATEHLGYWPSQAKGRAIDITSWRSLGMDNFPSSFGRSKSAICVKSNISQDRIDVCIAIRNVDKTYLEVIESFDMNTAWAEPLWDILKDFLKLRSCRSIVIDGISAQSSIKSLLASKGYWNFNGHKYHQRKVSMTSAADMTSAAALMVSSITEENIHHLNQEVLDLAVEDAGKRQVRSAGGFGFNSLSGRVDVNYLETASLALHAVMKQKVSEERSDSEISSSILSNVSRPFA